MDIAADRDPHRTGERPAGGKPDALIGAVWPGRPYPLGATWDGQGANFALYSENATKVELCLFDSAGRQETSALCFLTAPTWCGTSTCRTSCPVRCTDIASMAPTSRRRAPLQREQGPARPVREGHLQGQWLDERWGYKVGDPTADLSFDDRDNAAYAHLAEVVDEAFTWGDDRPPQTPWNKTIIYELHVKGFTKLHPDVPEKLRGTYAGLASEASIGYLKELGITAVELLPVHEHIDDRHLVERGLVNYWGYNTLGFFAPEHTYAAWEAAATVSEFKTMVRKLHSAGIEVILDVVYNHTAEGNQMGPTLSFRGIDNAAYYRLSPENSAITWTTPAAATRSTCEIRASCN